MNHFKNVKPSVLLASLVLALPAAQASSTYGTLSNFDVYNDSIDANHPSGINYYGFEIELDGLNKSQIWQVGGQPYTFNSLRYGAGQVTTDTSAAAPVTYIKYFKAGASTTAWGGAITATGGHACVNITGCEHFGTVLAANPTSTKYFWLDQNGNPITSSPVSLLAPINTVIQPAVPAQPAIPAQNIPAVAAQPAIVQAVMEAPEKPENEPAGLEFGDALWVKVYKTEAKQADKSTLEDLMADNTDKIADAGDGAAEVDWKIFQRHNVDPNDPKNKLDTGEQKVGADTEQVLRTYLFYKFTGTYDPESHEAICADGVIGGCEDYANGGNLDNVGKLIGQQMVALDLNLANVAAVPVPAAVWLFGSALAGMGLMGKRRKKSINI